MKKFFFALIALVALLAIVVWGGLLPSPSSSGGEPTPPSPAGVPTPTPGVSATPGIDAQEAKIEAEKIALALFPEVKVDRTTVELTDNGDSPFYECEIRTQDEEKIQVWIDPATGDLLGFSAGSGMMGRPAEPSLSMDEARETARAYVDEKSGGADLTQTSEQYNPFSSGAIGTVAGRYSFNYARLIRGVPCSSDCFHISVDAVTGEVCRYSKQWKTDEDLCVANTVPSVSGEDAKDAVRAYLKGTWGDLPGLDIHTADLRWYDGQTGSTDAVPLVWEVRFDDDHYRSLQYPHDTNAYVDAHTGEVLACSYHPDAT
ncbi:MAG: PepSY domain-containing protein [Methanofollis sp.]|uniref:PepSY domain-containing protein n=1 Tax=Methanofollis sp. TaxID=2052835 RepID=UPI0026070729|nr:PepSY domain-containing protein [Methanofollis sp.]MDD4255615.1 PepSY domain-containing protein [Methanofollis sp.]